MNREIFPKEVVSKAPRITLTGKGRLHVEQHQGLAGYQQEEVLFRTVCGVLRVTGSGLHFQTYTAGEALLAGRIDSVALEGEGSVRR